MEKLRRRTSENAHKFEKKLFEQLDLSELQGLLVDENWNATVGLEAIEILDSNYFESLKSTNRSKEDKEEFCNEFYKVLTKKDIKERYLLCDKLNIPFVLIFYCPTYEGIKNFRISMVKINDNGDIKYINKIDYSENDFIKWWQSKKGTIQTKQLRNSAGPRVKRTKIDNILSNYGLMWGGNIDAFKAENSHIECIIDFISCSRNMNINANPSKWYNSSNPKYGPKYEGFKTQSKVANRLCVPHLIIYLDKSQPDAEIVAISAIKEISPHAITLVNDPVTNSQRIPKDHITEGIENICDEIGKVISFSNPPIIK